MIAGLETITDGDIEIRITGLRPGEKLYEELLIGDNPQGTAHPRIMMAREVSMPWDEVEQTLNRLMRARNEFDCDEIMQILKTAPTGFASNGDVADLVWCNGGRQLTVATRESDKIRRFPA